MKRLYHYCKYCGELLNNSRKIYCNNKCQSDYQKKTFLEDWKLGKNNGTSDDKHLSYTIKGYIWEKYNSKCARCGWCTPHPQSGKPPLEVEHIDGNYLNNAESNLILLCPNCHALTATYRGRNKGNGRPFRV